MYRIRFHGRGGQGVKTASRILGRAFFNEGYTVQDAPRYGAERRGAPIFAYVRASLAPIYERGIIQQPDCIVVVDDTLMPVPAAAILQGCGQKTLVLIISDLSAEQWKHRLQIPGKVLCLPKSVAEKGSPLLWGMACVGAVARLLEVLSRDALAAALHQELISLDSSAAEQSSSTALHYFDKMAATQIVIQQSSPAAATTYIKPHWLDMDMEKGPQAAPAIYTGATSEKLATGLWRTQRPVIDHAVCNRCWWLCSTFCPEGAIHVDAEGFPQIDYTHCKGCLVCLVQCPTHAIQALPEQEASRLSGEEK